MMKIKKPHTIDVATVLLVFAQGAPGTSNNAWGP